MAQIAKPELSIDREMIENILKWYAQQLNCESLESLASKVQSLYVLCKEVELIKGEH